MLSIDANWSINKNLDERQYGRLTIDDFGCANLYLPFAFAKQFEEMTELSKYDYLYGLTNNNQFVVMEQCSEKSSNPSGYWADNCSKNKFMQIVLI